IGSVMDNADGALSGSAFVFVQSGGVWSEQQKFTASAGAANDKFGGSIAIDGDSLIVGAEGSDIGSAIDRGSAYVFSRSGNVWTEQQKLSASDGATSDFFGGSVAISGATILVGGYLDDNSSTLDQGSAYIFEATVQATPTPTPTATSTATPTPTPVPGQSFEGDISERPNGDGLVLSNDIAQMRRFIVGLDVPDTNTNEFQRADIAPFASAGDGMINSADATQARRYVTGLDPVQAAGGPTEPIASNGTSAFIDSLYDYFYAHEVRFEPENIQAGIAAVAVVTDAGGGENGLSFTLEFDAARLSNPKIALGPDAPQNAILTLNLNDVESGRVGILVDSSANTTAGVSRKILTFSFEVKPSGSRGSSTLRFTDTLAPKSISDIFGKSLSSKFIVSTIDISPAPILSGRVTMQDGRGIRSAMVYLTDADGGVRRAVTGSFGNYVFDNVQPGQRYTVSVQSKRYRFAVRIVEIADDLDSVDLIAID
ncbi:MAG: carboxypeptidase regulatory-like domain-containing protein, partial [Pyrinomonadaceae bacterium]